MLRMTPGPNLDMRHIVVPVDCRQITDWASFHSVFAKALGFPNFYGRNMSAWIDCCTCLDDPGSGMTSVTVPTGGVVVLNLLDALAFKTRCPEIYDALVECGAFVNWRRIERSHAPVLALAYHR
jgi:hypothetical protein